MSQLSLFDDETYRSANDRRPYPMRTATQYQFPLSYIEGDVILYSVRQWLIGVALDERYAKRVIQDWRGGRGLLKSYDAIVSIIEPDTYGRNRSEPYADEYTLYRIVQDISETTRKNKRDMTRINRVKHYLAKMGVFGSEVVANPERAAARIQGAVSRNAFTENLVRVVIDLTGGGIAIATNDVYNGLFHRTAAQLREQLNTKKPRDKMSTPSLHILGLCEWLCAQNLGEAQSLDLEQARTIIQATAGTFGLQVDDIERRLGIDIVTGKPLLSSEKD